MLPLSTGLPAPDFTLPDDRGTPFSLSGQRGHPVLLYFYPQADTPGCTSQNLDFSAHADWFAERGIILAGISPDSPDKLAKFRTKYDLRPFLLSDPEHMAIEPYGAWGEKNNYGRTYMGLIRTTVLVDAEGMIEKVWPNIRAKGHVDRVMKALG